MQTTKHETIQYSSITSGVYVTESSCRNVPQLNILAVTRYMQHYVIPRGERTARVTVLL